MTDPKFTKWMYFAVFDESIQVRSKEDDSRLATLHHFKGPHGKFGRIDISEVEANAHLFATAPELYAELARIDPTNPVLAKARGEPPR
jgi:hypothetical protein